MILMNEYSENVMDMIEHSNKTSTARTGVSVSGKLAIEVYSPVSLLCTTGQL